VNPGLPKRSKFIYFWGEVLVELADVEFDSVELVPVEFFFTFFL
jgi:hypothetical protein